MVCVLLVSGTRTGSVVGNRIVVSLLEYEGVTGLVVGWGSLLTSNVDRFICLHHLASGSVLLLRSQWIGLLNTLDSRMYIFCILK